MNILIRTEKEDDYSGVYAVNKTAFGQDNEAKLVNLLRNSDAFVTGLSLIACSGNKIIGHILFTKLVVEGAGGILHESLTLAPMAVLPDHQSMGVGSLLVKAGMERAKKLGFRSVIVLGHAKYYPRFGFVPASKWKITCPFDVPDEVFMALELVPGSLAEVSGVVRYPKEFETI